MTDAGTPELADTATVSDLDLCGTPLTPADSEIGAESDAQVPLAAGDDVVSAAQILVSYLWNSEYEDSGETQRGHIWQQLRTLTRWLTSSAGD
ncbi:hypothetical protein ACFWF3_01075 [Nocardia sp. NPDC060220]|uniref:hypothetical protein n=1 Tax=Nocardia sp. NPDC060220 TaxID=3347076 RepID=UPI003657BF25